MSEEWWTKVDEYIVQRHLSMPFDVIAMNRKLDGTALQTVGSKGYDGFVDGGGARGAKGRIEVDDFPFTMQGFA